MALTLSLLTFVDWLKYVKDILKTNPIYLERQFLKIKKRLLSKEVELTPELEEVYFRFLDQFAEYVNKIRTKWQIITPSNMFERSLRNYELQIANVEVGWSQFIVMAYVNILNKAMIKKHSSLGCFPSILQYAVYPAGFTLDLPDCQRPDFEDLTLTNIQIYEYLLPDICYFYLNDFNFLLEFSALTNDYIRSSYWLCKIFFSKQLRRQKAELLASCILNQYLMLDSIFPAVHLNQIALSILTIAYSNKYKKVINGQEIDIGCFVYLGYAQLLLESGISLRDMTFEQISIKFPFQLRLEQFCQNKH